MSSIIIYFSRTGENYVSGTIKVLEKGNTEIAAGMIQEITGADKFKAELIEPYSDDYNECIEQAREEQRRDARPELVKYPEHLEDYETVYLGFPNYWSTMPMCMFTLLEKCNLSGKVIMPFCTHEGSGLGKSEADIKKMCPESDVRKGLAIQGCRVNESRSQIEEWIGK